MWLYRLLTLAHISLFAYFIYFGVTIFTLGLDTVTYLIILGLEAFAEFINWGQYENFKDHLERRYVDHNDMNDATFRYLLVNEICALGLLIIVVILGVLYLGPLYIILMCIIMTLGTLKSLYLAKGGSLEKDRTDKMSETDILNPVPVRQIMFSFSTDMPVQRFSMIVSNRTTGKETNCVIGNYQAYIMIEPGNYLIMVFGEHAKTIYSKFIDLDSDANLTIVKGLFGPKGKLNI